jgi:hypothetical protein
LTLDRSYPRSCKAWSMPVRTAGRSPARAFLSLLSVILVAGLERLSRLGGVFQFPPSASAHFDLDFIVPDAEQKEEEPRVPLRIGKERRRRHTHIQGSSTMQRTIALGLGSLLVALAARPAHAQYNYPYPANYPNPYAYQQPMAYPPMAYPPVQYPGYGYPGYPQMMPQQPVMMSVTRVVPMQGPLETMPQGGPLSAEALATPGVPESTTVAKPLPAGTTPANNAATIVPTAASSPRVSPTPAAPQAAASADAANTNGESKKGLCRRLHDYLCGPKFQMDSK